MLNRLIQKVPSFILSLSQRWVYVVAFTLTIPGLFMGPFMDDYPQHLIFHGLDWFATPWDVYYFTPGNPKLLDPFIQSGPFPWWTLPELKLHFFRPLTSALTVLDHQLFSEKWWPRHLHSALWYLAFLFAWSRVLKSISAGKWGVFTLWITALFAGNVTPALWIANRNATIAATFGLLALAAHLQWREKGKSWGLPLSLIGLTLAFSAGEMALGVCGYIGAYELLGAKGALSSRLKHLFPATFLGTAYLLFYKTMGYGTFGSGAYIDPIGEILDYLSVAPGRMLGLIGQTLLTVPTDLQGVFEGFYLINWATGALSFVCAGILLKALWQDVNPVAKRHIPWLVAGSCFALFPVSATMPSGRLLLVASLGFQTGLAALLLTAAHTHLKSTPLKLFVLALFAMHLIGAPASFLGTGYALQTMSAATEKAFFKAEVDLQTIHTKKVIILAGPDFITNFYPPYIWMNAGYQPPKTWWVIAGDPHDHKITLLDSHRIKVEVLNGEMLTHVLEQLFRSPKFPFKEGQTIQLDGAVLTIKKMGEIGPTEVEVSFERPIDHPSHLFLQWKEGTLRPLILPQVGGSTTIPWSMGVMGEGF